MREKPVIQFVSSEVWEGLSRKGTTAGSVRSTLVGGERVEVVRARSFADLRPLRMTSGFGEG
jgi:hypothetical protein